MKTNQSKEISELFEGFKGLDTSSPIGSGRIVGLRNFKQLNDGSVIKRSGFKLLTEFPGEPRGETAYVDGGEEVILAVVGSSLYRVSTVDGSVMSSELFSTTEGRVAFFELRGELYISDGTKIYRYTGGTTAAACSPHVPLYGKNWTTNVVLVGIVNEPFNILTPRIRIHYKCYVDQMTILMVGYTIKSIDAVFINGVMQDRSLFSIYKDGTRVTCTNCYGCTDADVELFVTLDTEDYIDESFVGFDRAAVFDSFAQSRVFMYGGAGGGCFYVTPTVDEELLARENSVYGHVDPIYIPKGGAIRFGGMDSISGMCRVCDRMLIYSNHRAWMTSSLCDEEGIARRGVLMEVLSDTTGCTSDGALCIMGGATPVTVSRGGIYKWVLDTEFEEAAILTKISDKVAAHIDEAFLKNAQMCYNRDGDELWFGNTASENGEVLVYNCESGTWWSYEGVRAQRFIESGAGIAFVDGTCLYIFDDSAVCDVLAGGEREIEAVIESAGFDFSRSAQKKHICMAIVNCELDGGTVKLVLSDGRELATADLDESLASPLHAGADLFEMRLRTSRTERVKFTLRAAGKCRQRIYGIEFLAT